jgi:hypothetical protein
LHHARGLRGDIARRFQESVFAIGDQLRDAAHARGHRHHATCHRLQRHQPERLQLAGHEQHVRQRNEPLHVALFAEKRNVAIHFQFARQVLGGTALRSVAGHQQVRRHALADFGQNADAILHALHGAEIGKMNEQLFSRRGVRRCALLLFVGMVQSQLTKFLITRISFCTPKTSTVS